MFVYTEKYTESESDIQNNDSLYKTHQKHQNTFDLLEQFGKIEKVTISNFYFVISINPIIHILYFFDFL